MIQSTKFIKQDKKDEFFRITSSNMHVLKADFTSPSSTSSTSTLSPLNKNISYTPSTPITYVDDDNDDNDISYTSSLPPPPSTTKSNTNDINTIIIKIFQKVQQETQCESFNASNIFNTKEEGELKFNLKINGTDINESKTKVIGHIKALTAHRKAIMDVNDDQGLQIARTKEQLYIIYQAGKNAVYYDFFTETPYRALMLLYKRNK